MLDENYLNNFSNKSINHGKVSDEGEEQLIQTENIKFCKNAAEHSSVRYVWISTTHGFFGGIFKSQTSKYKKNIKKSFEKKECRTQGRLLKPLSTGC